MRFKLKRRLLYLGIGAAVFLAVYSAGAIVPLSDQESADARKQFAGLVEDIDEFGIFRNNFLISLLMFVPGLGAVAGSVVGFQTGIAYNAIVDVTPELASVPPQFIFILPHGIMELFVYGMAMSRSGVLFYRIVKDRPWRAGRGRTFFQNSLVPTFYEIGIAAAVLFAAALIEWWLIQLGGGLDNTGRLLG